MLWEREQGVRLYIYKKFSFNSFHCLSVSWTQRWCEFDLVSSSKLIKYIKWKGKKIFTFSLKYVKFIWYFRQKHII